MMQVNQPSNKSIRAFMITLIGLSFGAFMYAYDMKMENYNSTILAFSYKYGFISRGMIGTLYQGLDKLLPWNIMEYEATVNVTLVVTLLFFVFILCFVRYCVGKAKGVDFKNLVTIVVIVTMAIVTTFSHKRNFGRIDMFMLLIAIICAWLIIAERALVLVPILCVIGVMIHQGFMFMYANVVLVLLVYKALTRLQDNQGCRNAGSARKYSLLFIFTFLLVSIFFLYFELFSHGNGQAFVEEIKTNASNLSRGGKYHETLIDHEILGLDVAEKEWAMHIETWIEIPFFLILASPFIIIAINLCKRLLAACGDNIDRAKYIIIMAGPLTLLPLYIAKVDYGRWDFALLMYCGFVTLALLAMNDEIFSGVINSYMLELRAKSTFSWLLLIYAIVFMPFWDVHVCGLLKGFSNPINDNWLNLW